MFTDFWKKSSVFLRLFGLISHCDVRKGMDSLELSGGIKNGMKYYK